VDAARYVGGGRRGHQAARQAFPQWRVTPVVERARVMFRYKDTLEPFDELARLVTRENGKNPG
jgi:malonate-semialdehyde dehydrogenase (acetylating)/methylmalonate-semialdehyde dehydrogenase